MNKSQATFRTLTFFVFVLVGTTITQAQATRTWVSEVTGDDANPCSRTAPCKTFAGTVAKTSVNGEIDVIDAGGYGSVTIVKSLTIDGTGTVASIINTSGSGIIVNIATDPADPLRTVRLRGLAINGEGTGLAGIKFLDGNLLVVEDGVIDGFVNNGIYVGHSIAQVANLTVRNTSIRNIVGGNAVKIQNTAAGGLVLASFDKVQFANCGNGLYASSRSRANLRDCTITTNTTAGILSDGTSDVEVNVYNSSVTLNGTGIQTNMGTVRVASCFISGNVTGMNNVAGTIETFGTNNIRGNDTNTVGVITPVVPS